MSINRPRERNDDFSKRKIMVAGGWIDFLGFFSSSFYKKILKTKNIKNEMNCQKWKTKNQKKQNKTKQYKSKTKKQNKILTRFYRIKFDTRRLLSSSLFYG